MSGVSPDGLGATDADILAAVAAEEAVMIDLLSEIVEALAAIPAAPRSAGTWAGRPMSSPPGSRKGPGAAR